MFHYPVFHWGLDSWILGMEFYQLTENQMSTETQNLVDQADELFVQEQTSEALKLYKQAFDQSTDEAQKDYIQQQMSACAPEAPAELTQKKKNFLQRKFGNPFKLGGGMMKQVVKMIAPKIKPMIEKNKPKALAFMRGEMDFQGNPLPEGIQPMKRVVIIELADHPSGDPEKADIIVQVKRAEYTRVQTARDQEGNDIAHEQAYSAMDFIGQILETNMEDVVKNMDEMEME